MKKIYMFVALCLLGFKLNAQVVNIPDANFKTKLLLNTSINTNGDGEIQESEAAAYTGQINVWGSNIADLTGLSYFSHIQALEVSYNQISVLDVSNFHDLEMLFCTNNAITSINVAGCTALWKMRCNSNLFSILDMSLTAINYLNCDLCPNLTYVNAKNGIVSHQVGGGLVPAPPFISLSENPMLEYVCVDAGEEILWDNWSGINGSVPVTSYCSFVPGGEFNKVIGNIKYDCGGTNTNLDNVKINVSEGSQSGLSFTNANGNYSLFFGQSAVSVTPAMEHPNYFTVSPANYVHTFTTVGNVETADFCVSANGLHPDMKVEIIPLTLARPGFNTWYKIVYTNNGSLTQSGTVGFTYDDAVQDFYYTFPAAAAQSTGNITWDFVDLLPLESRTITVALNVNSPQETPAVNIGDFLFFNATITSVLTDETPADNAAAIHQVVSGSFDPNDKEVAEGAKITPEQIGDYLHYVIRFQNTGTTEAENVVVKDMLTSNLDKSTLEIVSASHPFRSTLTDGNRLEFFFENIMLPAVAVDEPGSHGYVAFRIKPASTVVLGSTMTNNANIYFDYNFPILTNTVSTLVSLLSNDQVVFDQEYVLAPNPVSDKFTISFKKDRNVQSVSVYNMLGQMVQTVAGDVNGLVTVDVAGLESGNYFVSVLSDKGKAMGRFVKR